MKFETYHRWTPETAQYPARTAFEALGYAALGLAGEVGELAEVLLGLNSAAGRVANQVKKVNRDDKGELSWERQAKIADEIGDVFWYLSQLCHRLEVDPGEVLRLNQAKLKRRAQAGTISGDKREEVGEEMHRAMIEMNRAEVKEREAGLVAIDPDGVFVQNDKEEVVAFVPFDPLPGAEIFYVRLTPSRGTWQGRTIVRQFVAREDHEARTMARAVYGDGAVIYNVSTSSAEANSWRS